MLPSEQDQLLYYRKNVGKSTHFEDNVCTGRLSCWSTAKMPLKVYIGPFDRFGASNTGFIDTVIKDALKQWAVASNNRITYKFVDNPADANIEIYQSTDLPFWCSGGHTSCIRENGPQTPGLVRKLTHSIVLLPVQSIENARERESFGHSVIHEIGHALGLSHSSSTLDVMVPFEMPPASYSFPQINCCLSDRDKAAIRRLYSADVEARSLAVLKREAEAGDKYAQLTLGRYYASGAVKDLPLSLKWIRASAAQNDPTALSSLANNYLNGIGVQKDVEKAKDLLRQVSDDGDLDALVSLGNIYYEGTGGKRDYAEAKRLYEKAADGGSSSACLALARLYRSGLGVRQDYKKCIELYKAASADELDAIMLLGLAYEHGLGVPKNCTKAIEYYEQAAHRGNTIALLNLGVLYERERDFVHARQCYQRALDLGQQDAYRYLGVLYENGLGVSRDLTRAATCYNQGAAAGSLCCKSAMAHCYLFGKGVKQDVQRALALYREASAANDVNAKLALAQLLTIGYWVPKNEAEASRLYEEAKALDALQTEQATQRLRYYEGIRADLEGNPGGAIGAHSAFLQTSGADTDTFRSYAAINLANAYQMLGRGKDAAAVLQTERQHAKVLSSWPIPIVRYLLGEVSQAEVLRLCDEDVGNRSEVEYNIAVQLYLKGQKKAAIDHLNWVVANGPKEYFEYMQASRLLKRLSM